MHVMQRETLQCTWWSVVGQSRENKIFNNKFTCSQTKCRAIIANVIEPFAMKQLLQELKEASFISLLLIFYRVPFFTKCPCFLGEKFKRPFLKKN
jgi:hypothetical protein